MSTSSKKSTKGSSSAATPQKEGVVVQRLARSVTRRLPKPRVGFETLVQPLAQLVEKYSADLGGSGIDVELMRSSLAAYQGLANEYRAALDHLASVESTRSVQASTTWMQILVIYDRARSVARTNPALAGDIEPFEEFMRIGPHKHRKTTTVTTP